VFVGGPPRDDTGSLLGRLAEYDRVSREETGDVVVAAYITDC